MNPALAWCMATLLAQGAAEKGGHWNDVRSWPLKINEEIVATCSEERGTGARCHPVGTHLVNGTWELWIYHDDDEDSAWLCYQPGDLWYFTRPEPPPIS